VPPLWVADPAFGLTLGDGGASAVKVGGPAGVAV